MILIILLLLAAHCAQAVTAGPGIGYSLPTAESSARASAMNETEALLQQLAISRIFSGAVAVKKAGTLVYAGGYGYAVEVDLT